VSARATPVEAVSRIVERIERAPRDLAGTFQASTQQLLGDLAQCQERFMEAFRALDRVRCCESEQPVQLADT